MTTETTTARPPEKPAGETPSAAADGRRPGVIAAYGRLWANVPRELGYLLPTLPVVIFGLVVTWALVSLGLGTVIIYVGIFVLFAALYVGRGFGAFELLRLRGAGTAPIEDPRWPVRASEGFWKNLVRPFTDPHSWLHLVHTGIVNPIVGTVTWSLTIAWVSGAIGGLLSWVLPGRRGNWVWIEQTFPGADPRAVDIVLQLAIGLVFLVTLPFVTRGLTLAHHGVARLMLARFRSEDLAERVAEAQATRTAAAAAEGTALRRLERDIHDGPQQRLVRLQMDIAAAERQLDTDPERARALLAEAAAQSRDALAELRALSRGFAPPILLDRGLVAALESLASRSTVPVDVRAVLPAGTVLPDEVERAAYFVASEAAANIAKHSGARLASLLLEVVPGDDGSRWLRVVVGDDGRGGAQTVPGHGLAGLDERVRGVGGRLNVWSPAGGPTTVTATLPLPPVA
ncbi:signal transduction histidine kinase [Labedella gwakjiensis]|uniref:histidine kinase n=1 Tax=Labedella gwakjiensis TaxID=390269 RepID=A0A2P8GWQ9_9MICO|nr:sensor histidine kinase [Labedella gwakjiensis]PSL38399.1 signal transduction histidine kinase [Labedella gwakjiensis]RUQ87074.1 sensor histidine kinase [Labedella gwakjiensis]